MTVALGILASDGLVVAADTEMTWGTLKTSERKVWTTSHDGGLAITGSGEFGYMDGARQRLEAAFKTSRGSDIDALETQLASELETFFARHVVPFAVSPEGPSFDLVVAAERNGDRRLWASDYNMLRRSSLYAAVGVGAEHAMGVLSVLLDAEITNPAKLNVQVAARLAGYVIHFVKERVRACGKRMHIALVRGGTATCLSDRKVDLLESYLSEYTELEPLAVQYALGYPFGDQEKSLDVLNNYYRGLRKRCTDWENLESHGQGRSLE